MVESTVEDHSIHVFVNDNLGLFSNFLRGLHEDIVLVVVNPKISLNFVWGLHIYQEICRVAH